MPEEVPKQKDFLEAWPEAREFQKSKFSAPSSPPPGTVTGERSMKPFIIVGIIVFTLLGGALFYFLQSPPAPKVSLEFSNPPALYWGQPFTVDVGFSNFSDKVLKNTQLSLTLPEGVSFVGQSLDQRVMERSLGDVGPDTIDRKQSFTLIATGMAQPLNPNQTLRRLNAKVKYVDAQNPSVQYSRDAEYDLQIGQPAVVLNVTAPPNVLSGEKFPISIAYQNAGNLVFDNLHLKVEYPPLFRFESASGTPLQGNNYWNLGSLDSGKDRTVSFTGRIVGPEQSFVGFNIILTADISGKTYIINAQQVNLAIAVAPLSLHIAVLNGENYVPHVDDPIKYVLTYKNNSDLSFQTITIRAKLIGDMYDFTSPRTDADFSSQNNTFTWFTANTPELTLLAPGESGTVTLDLNLKNSYPIKRLGDKNFLLRVEAEIESPTILPNTAAEKTISVATIDTKVGGKLAVAAEAYWRDAASGILNTGPFPPRVNKPTQFTVHWKISNYSTDVSNVQVSAFLQSGAKWTGKVKSTVKDTPTYDPATGAVTWNVGNISATKGVISAPIEATFQVEFTPPVNLVGRDAPLLSETKIQGTDSFTGQSLVSLDSALLSSVPDDKTIPPEINRQIQP